MRDLFVAAAAMLFMFFGVSQCLAQSERDAVDLLIGFDAGTDALAGNWVKQSKTLRVKAGRSSRARLRSGLPSAYRLEFEFTRISGEDVVAVILPIGSTSFALELSVWGGEAHGLARVDGQTSRSETNSKGTHVVFFSVLV